MRQSGWVPLYACGVPASVGLVPTERQLVSYRQSGRPSLRLRPSRFRRACPDGATTGQLPAISEHHLYASSHSRFRRACPGGATTGQLPAISEPSLRLRPFPLPSGLSRRSDNWSATGNQAPSLRLRPFPLPSGSSRRSDNWSATGNRCSTHLYASGHSRFRRARPGGATTGQLPAIRSHLYASGHSRFRRARPGGATTGQLPAISAETLYAGSQSVMPPPGQASPTVGTWQRRRRVVQRGHRLCAEDHGALRAPKH